MRGLLMAPHALALAGHDMAGCPRVSLRSTKTTAKTTTKTV